MLSATDFWELDLPVPRADRLVPVETNGFLLLREMHHRFANTLTILTSVLRHEFSTVACAEFQNSLAHYESRIVALGNLHRSLIIAGTGDSISVQKHVEPLCMALSEAILEPLGVRSEVTVDRGELPSERCELICLVIAELVTNAAKHAFHGRDDGLVRTELFRKAGSWLCIVSDNGRGTDMMLRGAGSKIVDHLVQALSGKLVKTSGDGGTSVCVTFPISET